MARKEAKTPPYEVPVVRIFLSSPGDVAEERTLARQFIDSELPKFPHFREKVRFELIAWDDPAARIPMLATETPQASVSAARPRPANCDIVIVILWSRMGTPLPADSVRKPNGEPYLSGTEWEYEDAVNSPRQSKPVVLVYRRTAEPLISLRDPKKKEKEEQFERVEAFFAQFRNQDGSLKGGINEYATPREFKPLLSQHIQEVVWRLLPPSSTNKGLPPTAATISLTFVSPFQAPPLPSHYVPRTRILNSVIKTLTTAERTSPQVISITAIHGIGGIGKTALATAIAHSRQLRQRYSGGVLWATLGQDPKLLPLLTGWIEALGEPASTSLTLERATAFLRSLLLERALMLVIDDVWQEEDLRPFLVHGPNCAVIVTTRRAHILDSLGGDVFSLEPMDVHESMQLIRKRVSGRLDLDRMLTIERSILLRMLEEVGHLPLAVEVIGGLLARGYTSVEIQAQLQSEHTQQLPSYTSRLQRKLDACLLMSVSMVRQEDEFAWNAFAWLALVRSGHAFSPLMTSTLWNTSVENATRILSVLVDDSLVQKAGAGFYKLHDLMHDVARRLFTTPPPNGIGCSIKAGHITLVQYYEKRAQKGRWDLLQDDSYIHSHLGWHLGQAGQAEELFDLLSRENDRGNNAWYSCRTRLGQSVGFLEDVRLAAVLTQTLFARDIYRHVHWALVTSSIIGLKNYSPDILAALVRTGLWSPASAYHWLTSICASPTKEHYWIEGANALRNAYATKDSNYEVKRHERLFLDEGVNAIIQKSPSTRNLSSMSRLLAIVEEDRAPHFFQAAMRWTTTGEQKAKLLDKMPRSPFREKAAGWVCEGIETHADIRDKLDAFVKVIPHLGREDQIKWSDKLLSIVAEMLEQQKSEDKKRKRRPADTAHKEGLSTGETVPVPAKMVAYFDADKMVAQFDAELKKYLKKDRNIFLQVGTECRPASVGGEKPAGIEGEMFTIMQNVLGWLPVEAKVRFVEVAMLFPKNMSQRLVKEWRTSRNTTIALPAPWWSIAIPAQWWRRALRSRRYVNPNSGVAHNVERSWQEIINREKINADSLERAVDCLEEAPNGVKDGWLEALVKKAHGNVDPELLFRMCIPFVIRHRELIAGEALKQLADRNPSGVGSQIMLGLLEGNMSLRIQKARVNLSNVSAECQHDAIIACVLSGVRDLAFAAIMQSAINNDEATEASTSYALTIYTLTMYLPREVRIASLRDLSDEGIVGPQIAFLTNMMIDLAAAMDKGQLAEFLEAAANAYSEWWVVEALTLVSKRVDTVVGIRSIMNAARHLKNRDLQSRILGRVAQRAADVGYVKLAVEAITMIGLDGPRRDELAELSLRLASVGDFAQAEEVAHRIEVAADRSRAFAQVALELGAQGYVQQSKELVQREVTETACRRWVEKLMEGCTESSGKEYNRELLEERRSIRRLTVGGDLEEIEKGIGAIIELCGAHRPLDEIRAAARAGDKEMVERSILRLCEEVDKDGQNYIARLASLGRPTLLRAVAHLAPVIHFNDGEFGVGKVVESVRSVCRWWQ